MSSKPLKDLVVLDMTRVLAGPYTGMILADMGADVLKIEAPGKGDDARAFGPFVNGESTYYMSLNRDKRSMTLNLKAPEGKEILKALVKKADVLLENFRGGTMEKLGLGYDVLKEINPRLVYSSCTGFGMTGPYKHDPAYDVIVQGMGGIMSITGQENGEPTRVGASIGDITAGLFSAIGVMIALYNRDRTEKGQLVDVSMLDGQVAILENAIAYGVSSMDDCGEIRVTGTMRGENIVFSVADNGIGMSEEEVSLILTDSKRVHKHGSGVGLVNVNNRIQILFGKEYGLTVESEPDEGTTVSICMPAVPYTEENSRILEKGYIFSREEMIDRKTQGK